MVPRGLLRREAQVRATNIREAALAVHEQPFAEHSAFELRDRFCSEMDQPSSECIRTQPTSQAKRFSGAQARTLGWVTHPASHV